MRIDVVTLFPEMIRCLAGWGVTGRALEAGGLSVVTWNPRDYATDRHHTVDDRPYGGGPGMVMRVEPLRTAIRAARAAAAPETPVVLLSPQGRRLEQATLQAAAEGPGLVLVCGRYEGIDERVTASEVDAEWSIGDYVVSGGELGAVVVIDGIARLLPGTLGDADSAGADSFMNGLLDHPHYTRPEVVDGQRVPEVLLGGDHEAIRRWRRKEALGRTWLRRPDLLAQLDLDTEARQLLDEFVAERQCPSDIEQTSDPSRGTLQ